VTDGVVAPLWILCVKGNIRERFVLILERRVEVRSHGLGWDLTSKKKRVACPHEAADGTVRAIAVRFELKEKRIMTPAI
jgi:hypothetical protein